MSVKIKLKKSAKSIFGFSRNFIRSCSWGFYMLINESFNSYISKKEISNKLLILANGPSLKDALKDGSIDIDSSDIRVVNDFCRFEIFYSIKPSSYVLADPFFFSDSQTERHQQMWDAFSKVNWNMTLFVPFPVASRIRKYIENSNIKIVPYHGISYDGYNFIRKLLYRTNLSMPRPQNVVIPSIFIGINEGYKRIELYGVDHSWSKEIRVNDDNQVCLVNSHFFDTHTVELKPWYKGLNEPVYKMHEILRDLAWMFDGYYKLKEYADSVGCRIVNKTPKSFIDAFEREVDKKK